MPYNAIPSTFPPVIVGRVKDEYFYQGDDTQRFPIGMRYRPGDKSFVYACAGATLNPDVGAEIYDYQHVGYTTIAANSVVGANEFIIDVSAAMGAAESGVIAEDELFGGQIVLMHAAGKIYTRDIVKNTAVATGEMTVTTDHGLGVALTEDTDHAECMASPYLDVRAGASSSKSICGLPEAIATVGQYVWLQTWGPRWIAPQAAVGTSNNDRQVVFRHDGSVDQHDYSDANVAMGQHAGWNMANGIGGGQGAAFIFLQISY